MSIPAQTCWGCQHFRFTAFESGYSEYTPGTDFDMECNKEQWKVPKVEGTGRHPNIQITRMVSLDVTGSQADFAAAMEIGFTCTEFAQR